VIAETTDLPTRYIKSVVTDDRGRYVIPDLPVANYKVWVRGYGLVDSPRSREAGPDRQSHRHCAGAERAGGCALLSGDLLVHDDEAAAGTRISAAAATSRRTSRFETWRQRMNNVDCVGCHQLGQESTRTIPAQLGEFKSTRTRGCAACSPASGATP
jgi:hypothetical protein